MRSVTKISAARPARAKLPLIGTPNTVTASADIRHEVEHRQHHVGHLLAEQKFGPRHRRHIQVDDGAEFFFPHHGQRSQHRGNHHQQHRNDSRHHRRQAFHVRVIAVAGFDPGGLELAQAEPVLGSVGQPCPGALLQIAVHGLGPVGMAPSTHAPTAVGVPRSRSRAKSGGDLDGQRQFAVAHAAIEFGVIGDRRCSMK